MAEIVVADAGPLIAFGRIRRVDVLPRVFERIVVPRAVLDETQVHPELPDAQTIAEARDTGLIVVDDSSPDLTVLPADADLEQGEAIAIALAAANGYGVLIDEKLGRAVAQNLDLRVIGTVGALLIARRRNLISAVRPLLDHLKASGHRLSDELIREALRLAGE